MDTSKWITPFAKQCWVVVGASVNMAQLGMVLGFGAALVPQLMAPDSDMPVTAEEASWLASLPGFTLVVGNLAAPVALARLGRRGAALASVLLVLAAWALAGLACSLPALLAARALQGAATGLGSCLTPIIIGECTSPEHRGAFTVLMALLMSTGTFTVHVFGVYLSWRAAALTCALVTALDLLLVALSPESPSWLAERGHLDRCRAAFRWLRGPHHEHELDKLIQSKKTSSRTQCSGRSYFKTFSVTVTKSEFYKPIIIMIHLYTLSNWAGINILATYITELVRGAAGEGVDAPAVVVSLGVQRMVSCLLAVFLIRRLRRRTMLLWTVGANAVALALCAALAAARHRGLDAGPVPGVLALHLLMFTIAIGSLPLPYTIAGEIFPLKYRGLGSGISSVFSSINSFACTKMFPYLQDTLGLEGAYWVYCGVVVYGLAVAVTMLPETKDRALADIEEDFRDKRGDPNVTVPLNRTADDKVIVE